MPPTWSQRLKARAKTLAAHTLTVYFVARDPALAWHVRGLALLVAAYALSPIDLIPDFIPVIGLLDDLILIPLGLALVIRLTPPAIIERAILQAQQTQQRPVSYGAALLIGLVWLAAVLLMGRWLYKLWIVSAQTG